MPIPYSALIQAGGAIAGSVLGRSKSPSARDMVNAEVRRLKVLRKKFGISPLAALGTQGPMLSTQVGSDYGIAAAADAIGSGLERDKERQELAKERELQRSLEASGQAQALRESQARVTKDEAMADYYNSLAIQARTARTTAPIDPSPSAQPGPFGGSVLVKPDEQISARSSAPNVTAGTHAGFREHVIGAKGGKLLFPFSEEGLHENMESMWSPFYAVPVIRASLDAYGPKAVGQALSELYGAPAGAIEWLLSDEFIPAEKMDAFLSRFRPRGGGASGKW